MWHHASVQFIAFISKMCHLRPNILNPQLSCRKAILVPFPTRQRTLALKVSQVWHISRQKFVPNFTIFMTGTVFLPRPFFWQRRQEALNKKLASFRAREFLNPKPPQCLCWQRLSPVMVCTFHYVINIVVYVKSQKYMIK